MVKLAIWLDEEFQIIRQKVIGRLTVNDALRIFALTETCARRLKKASEVRVLCDAHKMGKADSEARKAFVDFVNAQPDLKKLALYRPTPMARTILRFFAIITKTDKMRVFKTEKEALFWLCE